jgi:hypothetical protein
MYSPLIISSIIGMEVHICLPTALYNLSPERFTKSLATNGLSSGSLPSSNWVRLSVVLLPRRTCSLSEEPLLVLDLLAC